MYRIERTYGNGFRDHLYHLWEGTDLPTFVGAGRNPYLFDDKAEADRVAERLRARYPKTMETPHMPAQAITYTVIEVSQHPWAQYAVYSYDKWQAQFPNAVAAGCYDKLADAIKHADSVTYKMVVVDTKSESSGFAYVNWETQSHKDRLEYLRSQLRSESISYDELHELQSLVEHIDADDVELLEAAGVYPGEGYDEDWEQSLGRLPTIADRHYRGQEGRNAY